MKVLKSGLKWLTAVAVAVTGVALGGGNQFGPDAAFAKFDVGKLTVGGDLRVRGEMRQGRNFGSTPDANDQFVIQRTRLRLNYDTSPDVNFFIELQDSRAWGAAPNNGTPPPSGNLGFNSSQGDINGESLGLREGWIGIKNAGVPNLNLKLGRQKLVFGDQRLIGHFDWSNIGWSFDGVRADYGSEMGTHMFGYFRQAEGDCVSDTSLCGDNGPGTDDSHFIMTYHTLKMVKGMTIEPYWIYQFDSRNEDSNADGTLDATTKTARLPPGQNVHMFGLRTNGKAMDKMIDYTGEFVWQTGSEPTRGAGAASPRATINALATALKGGVTLPVEMKPRIGFEFNYATGSGNNDPSGRHTFNNFWPTNHLHYGYMDQVGWKNLVAWSPQLKIHPTKASNLKLHFWWFNLAQSEDNWYNAGQGRRGTSKTTNSENELGQEIDIIYTHKFKEGKIGFQVGYGHFFAGSYIKKSNNVGGPDGATNLGGTSDMDWAYVSVVTKF